jgi:hypothetical protein
MARGGEGAGKPPRDRHGVVGAAVGDDDDIHASAEVLAQQSRQATGEEALLVVRGDDDGDRLSTDGGRVVAAPGSPEEKWGGHRMDSTDSRYRRYQDVARRGTDKRAAIDGRVRPPARFPEVAERL